MKYETYAIRSGWDGKTCLVHARCCMTPDFMIATAQNLDVKGSDIFDGIKMSKSFDEGRTWTEFVPQEGLKPVINGGITTVACDATPFYHKKTGKILLTGHLANYAENVNHPVSGTTAVFYSVYDNEKGEFGQMKFVEMPEQYKKTGAGCSQIHELENGDLLVPICILKDGEENAYCAVMHCSFDGEILKFVEIGNEMTLHIQRGLCEPSVVFYKGMYYLTMRNDECAVVAKSKDGLHYTDMHIWAYDDGSLVQSYNTQKHFMIVHDELYLVYTKRDGKNDHVFRHRAPLYMAKVENMRLVRETEKAITPERGARCGNFGVCAYKDGKSMVMVAEWMQSWNEKLGVCEQYGSDNSVFVSIVG